MAITLPRTYMRTVLAGLSGDFVEWSDGFNFQNIPQTIIDRAYFIETGFVTSGPANQLAHEFNYPLTLRVFFEGTRDPQAKIDEALQEGDNILSVVLDPTQRLGQAEDIKDVYLTNLTVNPLDETNDNAVILQMSFNFTIIDCF